MSETDPGESSGAYANDETAGRVYGPILKMIAASRYLFALAVLSTFIGSVVLLLSGTWTAIELVINAVSIHQTSLSLRTQALEIVDHFLVSLVLYVMAGGFYQLMIRNDMGMPAWLRIRTPGRMERQLLGVIVTVMSVDALIHVANWDKSSDILGFGLAVAAIIVAITFYIWVHDAHGE